MTLMTQFARLRASLGFDGFKAGGAGHNDQADVRALKSQIAHITSTLPKSLRAAEAKAKMNLDKAQRAIRTWELDNQVKLAKAESDIGYGVAKLVEQKFADAVVGLQRGTFRADGPGPVFGR
jgi:hypothetical protein